MQKKFDDLVIQDFHRNPIWHPLDDFEDPDMLVEPFLDTTLHMEEIYLVGVKVTLADKSEYEGYVRISWGTHVAVFLSLRNDKFVSIPVERLLSRKDDCRSIILNELNKKEDDVFPFAYQMSVNVRLKGIVY